MSTNIYTQSISEFCKEFDPNFDAGTFWNEEIDSSYYEPLDDGGSVAGPNHPSRLWHQDRPDEWLEACKKGTLKEWQGKKGEIRRKATSNKMKETWGKHRELLVAHCRKVASKGGMASKEKCAKRLDYYGKTYIGWNELKKETGVSKHLYKKYYMNGINPEHRIGKNGPEAA